MVFGDSRVMRNGRLVPDRFAIMQAGNLYMYTMHNPVMWVDPGGEVSVAAAAGGLAAAAAAPVAVMALTRLTQSLANMVDSCFC